MFTRLWLVVPAGGEGMLHGAESPRSHCLHHRDRPHMCLAGLVRTAIQTEHSTFDTEFELMPLGRWLVHSYRQTHSISNLAVARKPEVLICYNFCFQQHGRVSGCQAEWSHSPNGHGHHVHRCVENAGVNWWTELKWSIHARLVMFVYGSARAD